MLTIEVAAIAFALLQAGAAISIRQAILRVARTASGHCPVRRALLPGPFGANEELMLTAEAMVEERLREEEEVSIRQERAPPEAAA